MHLTADIAESKAFVEAQITVKPTIGIILGSGLGPFADTLENAVRIPYNDIPHFASSSAVGHANELVIGTLGGKTVVAMKGRFHYYEGVSLDQVTFPVRLMKALGVEKLIITNACGAVNTGFAPGDLMLITDHLNLTANNPLNGPNNPDLGVRFLDVSEVYSSLQTLLATLKTAHSAGTAESTTYADTIGSVTHGKVQTHSGERH